MALFRALLRARDGTTAIEYGLLVLVIALALVGVLETIGQNVFNFYDSANQGFGG